MCVRMVGCWITDLVQAVRRDPSRGNNKLITYSVHADVVTVQSWQWLWLEKKKILSVRHLWYIAFSLCLHICYLCMQSYILRKPRADSAYCQALNEFCITPVNAELSRGPIQRTGSQLLECHHLPMYSISPTTSVHPHIHTDGERVMISMNSVLLFKIITIRAWKGPVVHFSSHWSHCGASPLPYLNSILF